MKERIVNLVSIAVGAGIGTLLRFILATGFSTGYPMGTFLANIIGSFVLGALTGWFMYRIPKEWVRLGLGVGLCGGFTTMSTLAADTVFLLENHLLQAVIYVSSSLLGGIVCALIGYSFTTKLSRRKEVGDS
ncbi:fluoride efflux transporter FluC [Halalkalibacter urbisdiaboli]|uniref:fluoride efflux transporter FluC n=1 Tax=Halalkalibacter urbisdiaboli TaxID=1960589 RepID=UPI000B43F0B7|nr:CrcB family protein [Halalkalibacter urbisdiaboli]